MIRFIYPIIIFVLDTIEIDFFLINHVADILLSVSDENFN